MSREQRAIKRRNKLESSLTSSGSGGPKRSRDGLKGMRRAIKKMFKLQAIQAALVEFEERLCDVEEERFGDLPDREVSNVPFEEKAFGHAVERGQQLCRTSASDTPDLSDIVVSLALFDGDKMLFACSGIPLPEGRAKMLVTRFVTSARLVTAFNDNRNKDDKLRIEVRLPKGKITNGFLGLYDQDIAIVTSVGFLNVHPVDMEFKARPVCCDDQILAAGRAFKSCSLMAMYGSLSTEHRNTLVSDSQDFPEAVLGGPLIGSDKRFLGMSLDLCGGDGNLRCTSFLPLRLLCERLKHFEILNPKQIHFLGYSLPKDVKSIVPSGFRKTIYRLRSRGYPMPPSLVLEFNGRLLNRFEERFGELRAWKGYPFGAPPGGSSERIWAQLGNKIATDMSRRVVSLASFHEFVRYFACTGMLIKWNGSNAARTVILTSASLVRSHDKEDNVDNNLRIEVFLPPNQRAIGKLEFYSLNYNIAIVSVKNLNATRPEDIFNNMHKSQMVKGQKSSGKVAAIGRDTIHGLLMASIGEVKHRNKAKLDCKDLQLSTCKIKKAGIGGPLINFDGSFVGMNFYDGNEITPFLPRSKIVNVLSGHIRSSLPSICMADDNGFFVPIHIGDDGGRTEKNKWPVPEPYWSHGALDVDRSYVPELIGRTLN
uniref:Uncharacterized protein n=1 Tax=Arundo donax TaxID=35708 RepID=A0A0A8Y0B2_ARUDO